MLTLRTTSGFTDFKWVFSHPLTWFKSIVIHAYTGHNRLSPPNVLARSHVTLTRGSKTYKVNIREIKIL